MTHRLVAACVLCVSALAMPPSAGAQQPDNPKRPPPQTPEQRIPREQRPVAGGTVVRSEVEGTVVWLANDGLPFQLRTLVNSVAPIVWISPDEPLRRAGANLPQPLPPLQGPYPENARSLVYYTIPMVRLHNTGRCAALVDAQRDDTHQPLAAETLEWTDEPDAAPSMTRPPLDCLDLVRIRFFLYYTSEVGVSAHANDFESVQVNVRVKANRPKGQDATECAVDVARSKHCAIVTGVFGSAHGIAWYTNGLNVENNQDTLLPVSVLVEEGKHASAPDRNGDGTYTPGFDVDMQPNDAWGVRDVLRTRWLQGPAFRGDMAKRRLVGDRIFPVDPHWRIWLNWLERTAYPEDAWARIYNIENIRTAIGGTDSQGQPVLYCDANSDHLSDPFRNPKDEPGCGDGSCETLEKLFESEQGCRRTRVLRDNVWQKALKAFARVNIGGLHDEYLTWPRFFKERLAPQFRWSGTSRSGAWTPPIAWNVPGLDGWVSARWSFWRKPGENSPLDSPVDVMYSVSAARYVSWYVAVGRDTLPTSDAEAPGKRRTALEGGIKWRFRAPVVDIFSGIRIGLRADDPNRLRYPRVILEIGGGSW